MKVLSVLRAESVSALRTVGGDFGYLPEALSALIEQYGFLSVPTAEELTAVDPSKGMTFRRGKLELGNKLIAIDYLQVFAAGLSVATHTNTSESDIVLKHVKQWAQSQFKFEFEELKPGIGHASQLEIRLDRALPKLFPLLSEIGNLISASLDNWWGFKPPYELINLNWWYDRSKFPQFAPPIFRLDRRENVPFEQRVYYAEAPMSTDDHIAVLTRFEKLCVEALGKRNSGSGGVAE